MRGYKEEGTITTPFDMAVLDDLDRYHLASDAIARTASLGSRGAEVSRMLGDTLTRHRAYINEHGEDMPDIREWRWG